MTTLGAGRSTDADGHDFRPVTSAQDWEALAAWLSARGLRFDDEVTPRQFAGGLANQNFLISVGGSWSVLRLPPRSAPEGRVRAALREQSVLEALSPQFTLAPCLVAACDDPTVLGVPFQILEFREGAVFSAEFFEGFLARGGTPDDLIGTFVGGLAELHRLDLSCGRLSTLGRPESFVERQLAGWRRRGVAAYGADLPDSFDTCLRWLHDHQPNAEEFAVLHGDYKLDNVLFTPDGTGLTAVVDWELATLGDPLFDLGVALAYWVEPDDPEPIHALEQAPSLLPGVPGRRAVIERYVELTGRDATTIDYYLVLGRLRLAVAWQQLFVLYASEPGADPRYRDFDALSRHILEWALAGRPT